MDDPRKLSEPDLQVLRNGIYHWPLLRKLFGHLDAQAEEIEQLKAQLAQARTLVEEMSEFLEERTRCFHSRNVLTNENFYSCCVCSGFHGDHVHDCDIGKALRAAEAFLKAEEKGGSPQC
jgi:hypothetical protein